MVKKISMLLAVVALSIGLMACAEDNVEVETPIVPPPTIETPTSGNVETPMVGTPSESETPSNNSGNEESEATLSALEIFDRYTQEYPNIKFEELSLERDFGKLVYNMDGYEASKEYDFKISAQDGSIIKEEIDNNSDFSGEITREQVDKIESFVDKALADAGNGATLYEWGLGSDKTMVKIEIEVKLSGKDDVGYIYDVNSGELLEKDK